MLQVSTSGQQWEVEYEPDGRVTIAGESFAWDLVALGSSRYHLLYEGRSYAAELVSLDRQQKNVVLKLNGQVIELQAKDRFGLLLAKLGMSDAATAKVNELKAPMPGLIVDVRVVPGQVVQKGDPLLVLEAMKMENILKAPSDGIIEAIRVDLRANVTKGQVLVQFQ